jgi:nucleoporin NUP82
MDPSLSIDLKKLANAESDQEDLSASKYGAPKGFSPDSFELEVASACFGDFPDQEGVHGWAPMTLWIAMVEGDVYALCPLLPSKWQLYESSGVSTVLQTLASSINSDWSAADGNTDATPEEKETTGRQLQWLFDFLYTEPLQEQLPSGDTVQIFARPASVPACPLLQGPFQINQSEDEYFELSDIIVFSLKTFSESDEEELVEGLPAAVVCLLTDTSKIHVCLDLLGIVGRWLPSVSTQRVSSWPAANYQQEKRTAIDTSTHELNLVETIVLSNEQKSSFNQSITPDVHTDFSFFVSLSGGTYYISLEPWIRKLEEELADPQNEGIEVRLRTLLDSATTQVDACMQRQRKNGANGNGEVDPVTACVVVENGNVGYLVLTVQENGPQAVILDAPEDRIQTPEAVAESLEVAGMSVPTREFFAPSKDLWEPLQFLQIKDRLIPPRHTAPSKEEIRLSPANLDILMNAHKALSQDTHKLQTAVSDLFVRCERLRDEFRDQIVRTAQLADKIDSVTGNDDVRSGSDSVAYGSAKIEDRLDKVKAKQEALSARYDAIRRKMAHVGGTELSEKETALNETLRTMERSLDRKAQTLTDDADGSEEPAWQRLERIKQIKQDLASQVERHAKDGAEYEDQARSASSMRVPSHSRKLENEQVEALLQRETALVESATGRLRSLGIAIPG